MSQKLIIYARYSSDMQSPKSCADQERDIRAALTRLGIDHRLAVVIYDEAESGTKIYRPEFERLTDMVNRREAIFLVVDDQARLTRADNALAFITDIVFAGGRWMSTGEGICTTQPGWELRVKVMELHNSTTIRELGRRVRRGQKGRLLAGLTNGDYPFGYESFLVHPERFNPNVRGPKPEKNVRIKESEALWVRQIFVWFLLAWSLTKIAEELTRQVVRRSGKHGQKPWTTQQVRSILSNPMYFGIWVWGKTTTLRNSQGKTKQIDVPEDQWVRAVREDLRIIDQATWEQAQERLAELNHLYGYKKGQSKRGPRVHHTAGYPSNMLLGLVHCQCGARMHYKQSGKRRYLRCPRSGKAPGMCPMRTTVPFDKAQEAILTPTIALLTGQPGWVARAIDSMRRCVTEILDRTPHEAEADQKRLAELTQQIETLIDNLSTAKIVSDAATIHAPIAHASSMERMHVQLASTFAGSRMSLTKPSIWLAPNSSIMWAMPDAALMAAGCTYASHSRLACESGEGSHSYWATKFPDLSQNRDRPSSSSGIL